MGDAPNKTPMPDMVTDVVKKIWAGWLVRLDKPDGLASASCGDELSAEIARRLTSADLHAAEIAKRDAEIGRLRDALGIVADQATAVEWGADEKDKADASDDWHAGYDAAIERARAALSTDDVSAATTDPVKCVRCESCGKERIPPERAVWIGDKGYCQPMCPKCADASAGDVRRRALEDEPEPVAYRCKDFSGEWFVTNAKNAWEHEHGAGGYCEPLYARSALPAPSQPAPTVQEAAPTVEEATVVNVNDDVEMRRQSITSASSNAVARRILATYRDLDRLKGALSEPQTERDNG